MEQKTLWNMKMMVKPKLINTDMTVPKVLVKVMIDLEIKEQAETSIVTITQNTEKSPGDLLLFKLQRASTR